MSATRNVLVHSKVPAIQIEDHCGGVGRGREPWCEERVGLSEDWLFAIYTKQLNVDIKL